LKSVGRWPVAVAGAIVVGAFAAFLLMPEPATPRDASRSRVAAWVSEVAVPVPEVAPAEPTPVLPDAAAPFRPRPDAARGARRRLAPAAWTSGRRWT